MFLQAPAPRVPTDVENLEALDSVEEYSGPTADQLRREAEEFKKNWEVEREKMIEEAKEEAQRIIKEAEDEAFRQIREKTEQANAAKSDAEAEAEAMRAQAQGDAGRIVEPLVCEPSASGTMNAPTAAAEPLDEPPGVCSALCGLVVFPGA